MFLPYIVIISTNLIITSISLSADYYVSFSQGNDSWNGLASTYQGGNVGPWKTIGKVNLSQASFNPGDKIHFKGGDVWNENSALNITKSGSEGMPIIYTSYGEGYPKLRRGAVVTGWSGPDENGVYSIATTTCSALWEDDILMKRATTASCSDGSWYLDGGYLYYKPSSGVPTDHTVVRQQGGGCSISASYVTIDNLQFFSQIYTSGGSFYNVTIQNCLFDNSSGGIFITCTTGDGHNYTIQNNIFRHSTNNIYLVSGDGATRLWRNTLIKNNTITNWNMTADPAYYGQAFYTTGDRDGLSFQNLKDSIVEYNHIYNGKLDTGGICHWIKTGVAATGNIIRYNRIHDIYSAGIINDGGSDNTANCKIYGNIIYNYAVDNSTDCGGIRLNRAQTSTEPSEVYNNTIYNGDIGIYLNSLPNNYIIKNNIVHTVRNYFVSSNTLINQNILDFNCYYPGATGSKFRLAGTDYTFSGWKTATGQDGGSITAEPVFVNPLNGDFRLQSGSPAITAGVPLGLTKDYLGNKWRNPPSMGAIEYYKISGKISPKTLGGVNYGVR